LHSHAKQCREAQRDEVVGFGDGGLLHGHLDSNNRLTLVAEYLETIECEFNEKIDHLPTVSASNCGRVYFCSYERKTCHPLFGEIGGVRKSQPLDLEEETTDAWTAVESLLAEEKRKVAKARLKEKEENLINGFIVRTRWDESVLRPLQGNGKSWSHVSHFGAISDMLRGGDILSQRKIMSDG